MQVRLVIIPGDDGLNVVVWGKWTQGSMRVRQFETRASMICLLETLHLITPEDARHLEGFDYVDSCPLFSAEIDEETLSTHGFVPA